MSLPKAIKGEKAKMVKTELKSLKDTLLSKYADIENVNGIKPDITWRSFWNGEDGVLGPIAVKSSVYSWPTIYLIDAKGIIRYKNVRGAELDAAITKLMAETGYEVKLIDVEKEKEVKKIKEKV